jgi:alpha-glucosidase (family GH31 glycosyl hydrolase)
MSLTRSNAALFCIGFVSFLMLPALAAGAPTGRPGNPPAGNAAADPAADPAAVVRSGDVRFTLLTDRLVRMEWSPDGTFEDRASLVFINRKLPVPRYSVDSSGDTITISTGALLLRYLKGSGKFTGENLSVGLTVAGRNVTWGPGSVDSLNLKGTTRTLDGTNGAKDVTLEDGILSRSGWAIVDDSKGNLFDRPDTGWVTPRPAGGRQDWYFFGYGHDYRRALHDFTLVAGKIPMPPRFAFGYWWSRYWTYSDAELRSLVRDMDTFGVPIDVLIVDMDWHETFGLSSKDARRDPAGQEIGWTGYTWNRKLFPSPETFFSFVHREGLRSALNLHPASGVPPMEERYDEFAKAYGFDTSGRPYIPFAIEDKKWTRTWFDVILHPLERQGVDFWWLDWQAWLENTRVPGLSNTWWLNHVFFTDMERRAAKRPLLFHRWGGLGNHRYQIGFSGDSWSTWEALAFQPYFTATAGNVGYGYWSHDIGGHVGNDPDPELYLRWLQWGVFSPIVRTHSTKSSTIERRIWKYPDRFVAMREALRLRYRMNPYIYTASREAFDTGVSICRPMYYAYPENDEAYTFTGQYMFGDDMLVAPVTAKASPATGLSEKTIWLPEGEWFEWSSGTLLGGGRTVPRSFTAEEIPVYVRADAVIPMYPHPDRLGTTPDTLVLMVAPGSKGAGSGLLYEDDGSTNAYRRGEYATTRFTKETAGDGPVRVTVLPREGSFSGMRARRSYVVDFPSTLPPSSVTVNGVQYPRSSDAAPGRWTYDASFLGASVMTPPVGCGGKVVIELAWNGGDGDGTGLVSGMSGILGRLPKVVQTMKDEVNLRDQIANAPASVLAAGSLETMIAYEPDRCAGLIRDFRRSLPGLVRDVVEYPGGDPGALEPIVHLLPADSLVCGTPAITVEPERSTGPGSVTIASPTPGAVIRYTLDGSLPDSASPLYTAPVMVDRTSMIRARAFRAGMIPGFSSGARFQLLFANDIAYEFPNSPKYGGGGNMALADGVFGSVDDFRKGWVGFRGDDLVATVTLDTPRAVRSVALRCLQNQRSWIFLPVEVTLEVSTDGVKYETVGTIDSGSESLAQAAAPAARTFSFSVARSGITHIRIRAKNAGVLPPWHASAGERAWLFADEIVLE